MIHDDLCMCVECMYPSKETVMAKSNMMFRVTIAAPDGIGVRELQAYIREALETWCKSFSPDDPMFDLKSKDIQVIRLAECSVKK